MTNIREHNTKDSGKYKSCIRYNVPGQAHALTFSCFHHQPLLSSNRSRQWLMDAIAIARTKHHFEL